MLIKMFKEKIKRIFTNWRVILMLVALVLAIISIHPRLDTKGVMIKNVISNSSANIAGIQQVNGNDKEIIQTINNKKIEIVSDYHDVIASLKPNSSILLRTNKASYRIFVKERFEILEDEGFDEKIVEEIVKENITVSGANGTNETIQEIEKLINKTISVPKTKAISRGAEDIGLRVGEVQRTNIKLGLDLQGGTRVLLQPEKKLSPEDLDSVISIIVERLNIYGLSDIVVRGVSDLSNNQYIMIEIAGATDEDVKELIAKQGKFEAKIANQTVFVGGKDITYVCKSSECAGIERCDAVSNNQYACRFRFAITMTQEAAERHADITRDLQVVPAEDGESYLSEPLILYLDDKSVDQLRIHSGLRGQASTQISISGSGVGPTEQDAVLNTVENMKRLQTVLTTGSLPVKLNVIKIDNVSASLGKEFISNALFIGMLAIIAVIIVIFFSYRKPKVVLPIVITIVSELIIILGVASLIGWNIDLAAIAGIIIAIGTGVDHQIVITDETLKGSGRIYNWKERFKNAFFIIMGTFFCVFVAMIPLLFAGAGLLKGFALTTIIGVSLGVFITRPAYAAIIEVLLGD